MIEYNGIMRPKEDKKGSDTMLTEERHEKIMRLVNTSGAVSVQDLVSFLNISESTVRRDLLTLDREGRLRRVHGGATTLRDDSSYEADMENLQDKYSIHMSDKRRIAQYAASLIKKDDFVYLDAGSTTEQMADFLGVTRPSLSRELAAMRDEGLLDLHGRRVRVPDTAALRRICEYPNEM